MSKLFNKKFISSALVAVLAFNEQVKASSNSEPGTTTESSNRRGRYQQDQNRVLEIREKLFEAIKKDDIQAYDQIVRYNQITPEMLDFSSKSEYYNYDAIHLAAHHTILGNHEGVYYHPWYTMQFGKNYILNDLISNDRTPLSELYENARNMYLACLILNAPSRLDVIKRFLDANASVFLEYDFSSTESNGNNRNKTQTIIEYINEKISNNQSKEAYIKIAELIAEKLGQSILFKKYEDIDTKEDLTERKNGVPSTTTESREKKEYKNLGNAVFVVGDIMSALYNKHKKEPELESIMNALQILKDGGAEMQGKIGLKQNKKYTVNFDEETAKKAYNQIMFLYEDSDEEEEDEVLNEQEGGFVEEEADEPADNAMAQADSYENKDSEDLIRMAHNNDIHAAYVLGKRYYNNGARDLAEEYLRFATNRGHRDACELLDKMWGGDSTIAVLGQDDLSEVD